MLHLCDSSVLTLQKRLICSSCSQCPWKLEAVCQMPLTHRSFCLAALPYWLRAAEVFVLQQVHLWRGFLKLCSSDCSSFGHLPDHSSVLAVPNFFHFMMWLSIKNNTIAGVWRSQTSFILFVKYGQIKFRTIVAPLLLSDYVAQRNRDLWKNPCHALLVGLNQQEIFQSCCHLVITHAVMDCIHSWNHWLLQGQQINNMGHCIDR